MRNFAFVLIILTTTPSFAQTPISRSIDPIGWLQSMFNGLTYVSLSGVASEKDCQLQLADNSHMQTGYDVIVNFESEDANDYIGVITTEAALSQPTSNQLKFASNQSWGNDSTRNMVTIELNSANQPVRATGVSDILAIDCVLNLTTNLGPRRD